MKLSLLLFSIIVLAFVACSENSDMTKGEKDKKETEHSEMNHSDDMPMDKKGHGDADAAKYDLGDGAYGLVKIDDQNVQSAEMAYRMIETSDEAIEVKAMGEISEVCKSSGCWVNVKAADKEFLVLFKDHFSIPKKGVVGRNIIFQGIGSKNEDGEVQVEADGVLIL